MTTYSASAVSNTSIAYENGITIQQGRALRDNPLAMAEAATDAPYIWGIWHPYDGVTVGDGNDGEIWSFGTDGTVTEIEMPDFDDGYEYQIRFAGVSNSGGTTSVTLQPYGATTGSYASGPAICSIGTTASYGRITIEAPRVSSLGFPVTSTVQVASGTTVTDVEMAILVPGTTEKLTKVKLVASNINGGAVYLYRRRVL